MNYINAIILAIVQAISQFLPISNYAHLEIFKFLNFDVSDDFYHIFVLTINIVSMLALLFIYHKKLSVFSKSKNPLGSSILEYFRKDRIVLWIKIVVCLIPSIIYNYFLKNKFNIINGNNKTLIIGLSLLIIGILMIVVELIIKDKKTNNSISISKSLIIGTSLLLSDVFPVVSIFSVCIIVGLLLNISRNSITEFCFELSIPFVIISSLVKLVSIKYVLTFSEILLLITGSITCFVISLFMIKLVIDYVKKNNFVIFGIYRILLSVVVLLFMK